MVTSFIDEEGIMRAITYARFGPAEDVLRLAEIDTPRPGPGEVCVTLVFSGVNPSDVKARAGTRPGVTKPPFDLIIPHSDGAGVISDVGEGVDPARIGERVWIWNGQWQRPFGTAATHITLPSAKAVLLPAGVCFEAGAVLGIPGLTASHCVHGHGDISGKTVLIQGGAGTVGFLAVQLAKLGGAHVIATARGDGLPRCIDAGADAALDYTSPTLAADILAANNGKPVDRIVEVEFGQNIQLDAEVITPNGVITAYGSARQMSPTLPFGPLLFKAVTIDITLIYILDETSRRQAIEHLHDALTSGRLQLPVDAVFALSDCAAAHRAVEQGGRSGAVLIDVTG